MLNVVFGCVSRLAAEEDCCVALKRRRNVVCFRQSVKAGLIGGG